MRIILKYYCRQLKNRSEYHPIVDKNLLLTIKEVLGDNDTDEILNDWDETYEVIFKIFIDIEKVYTINSKTYRVLYK